MQFFSFVYADPTRGRRRICNFTIETSAKMKIKINKTRVEKLKNFKLIHTHTKSSIDKLASISFSAAFNYDFNRRIQTFGVIFEGFQRFGIVLLVNWEDLKGFKRFVCLETVENSSQCLKLFRLCSNKNEIFSIEGTVTWKNLNFLKMFEKATDFWSQNKLISK